MRPAAIRFVMMVPPGAGERERYVSLAGALAEHGVSQLRVTHSAGVVEVAARSTDLPGLLALVAPCRLTFNLNGCELYYDVEAGEGGRP